MNEEISAKLRVLRCLILDDKNFMKVIQIPEVFSFEKGYKKCLVAETTMNYTQNIAFSDKDLEKK